MFYRRKSFLITDNAKVVLKLLTITERILWEILVVYFRMILAYNLIYVCMYIRLPWWLSGQESVCNAGDARDMGSTLGHEDPLEEEMATYSIFLPGESHGQRSLAGFSLWGHKKSDTT